MQELKKSRRAEQRRPGKIQKAYYSGLGRVLEIGSDRLLAECAALLGQICRFGEPPQYKSLGQEEDLHFAMQSMGQKEGKKQHQISTSYFPY